ncbi:MAG TPA: hypothetical protein VGP92_00905, partial [Acidimicrobiia bacterium]|nr:hypothetical protein [Acidimicrobiia bacterium]
ETIDVTIPANVKATLQINGKAMRLGSGRYQVPSSQFPSPRRPAASASGHHGSNAIAVVVVIAALAVVVAAGFVLRRRS